jgi:uncharacterized oligopeptide transporter (OPT) family protein
MLELARQIHEERRAHRRRLAGRSAASGGGLFMLAAIAFLASFSPFTFLPFLAAAVLLGLLGVVFMAITPLMEFFW